MKKILSGLRGITISFPKLGKEKSKQIEEKQPKNEEDISASVPTKVEKQVIKVSDEIQLTIQGLPSSLQSEHRDKIVSSLVDNTLAQLPNRSYQKGERIHKGQAHLQIEDQVYDIVYALDVTRAVTALQIYKEAFDTVRRGAEAGVYDPELAELTEEYLKESAWQAIQPTIHPRETHRSGSDDSKSDEPKMTLSPPKETEQ